MYLMNISRNFVQTRLTIPNDGQIGKISMLLVSNIKLYRVVLDGFLNLLVIQYWYALKKIFKSFIVIHERVQPTIEIISVDAYNWDGELLHIKRNNVIII